MSTLRAPCERMGKSVKALFLARDIVKEMSNKSINPPCTSSQRHSRIPPRYGGMTSLCKFWGLAFALRVKRGCFLFEANFSRVYLQFLRLRSADCVDRKRFCLRSAA